MYLYIGRCQPPGHDEYAWLFIRAARTGYHPNWWRVRLFLTLSLHCDLIFSFSSFLPSTLFFFFCNFFLFVFTFIPSKFWIERCSECAPFRWTCEAFPCDQLGFLLICQDHVGTILMPVFQGMVSFLPFALFTLLYFSCRVGIPLLWSFYYSDFTSPFWMIYAFTFFMIPILHLDILNLRLGCRIWNQFVRTSGKDMCPST